jgi:hypothetical protein
LSIIDYALILAIINIIFIILIIFNILVKKKKIINLKFKKNFKKLKKSLFNIIKIKLLFYIILSNYFLIKILL